MNSTAHSEYLRLRSVYLKSAEDSFISNGLLEVQWQELNYLSKPDYNSSLKEYTDFRNILKSSNIEIHQFPKNNLVKIDSIYCRDASIATDFGMIICNMGKEGRRNEPQAQKNFYKESGISILGEIKSPGTLEGGDVCWLDEKTLAVGHTYRTNEEGIKQLKNLLEPKGIEIIVAELPHYRGKSDVFHLMSILSPVDKDLAVVYSQLMPIRFRNRLLEMGYKFVEVPEEEFDSMGSNVLAIAPRKCIVVDGNPITKKLLESTGSEVLSYKGNEISIKGGGGPTCLTRPLLREY